MNRLKNLLKNMERKTFAFLAALSVCAACVVVFLVWYFGHYGEPYMQNEIINLSEGWHYSTAETGDSVLKHLRAGPVIEPGETLTMYRTLNENLREAAILIRTNHQAVNVYLDGVPLYVNRELAPKENPGMALHFILLPDDYLNQTLKIELTSPYTNYAGRTSPILMGTIPSLEAFTISRSIRSVILMSMCLLLGLCVIALTFLQTLEGSVCPQNLALGIFAVIWALYYICTDYIAFQFFTPVMVSALSLGLYFAYPVPLMLFYYFSFKHYRKWMLPILIPRIAFTVAAILLQLLGVVDFPWLVDIHNALLLAGIGCSALLAVLEALKKNRMMMVAAPLIVIPFISNIYNMNIFYNRLDVVPYVHTRDAYFVLILAVLIYGIGHLFSRYYRSQREYELLSVKNRYILENYQTLEKHMTQIAHMKHEIRHHLFIVRELCARGEYEGLLTYLSDVQNDFAEIEEPVACGNHVIQAVLGHAARRAKELGFAIDFEILFLPPLAVPDTDLVSLFMNLLDNALESCSRVEDPQKRWIKVRLKARPSYMCLSITNAWQGKLKKSGNGYVSSKDDSIQHGHGIEVVRKIVEKHDGLALFEHTHDTFSAEVALPVV